MWNGHNESKGRDPFRRCQLPFTLADFFSQRNIAIAASLFRGYEMQQHLFTDHKTSHENKRQPYEIIYPCIRIAVSEQRAC